MNIPHFVLSIINKLETAGYEAYAVGGCVRDILMGKIPSDWDITTSALPEQTEKVFSEYKTYQTGIKHGTITVLTDNNSVEITTYRIDGAYSDNRRPDKVTFTSSLEEDLSRRDFTVNAMAYNPKTGIVDLFGGQNDIQSKIIKCVGEPTKRFHEDALRIMRALRFAAVCNFEIDEKTSGAVIECRHLLSNIAAERISSELSKLLLAKNPAAILNDFSDVILQIFPEITTPQAWGHINTCQPILEGRLALLLCPSMSRVEVSKALRRLKFDNKTRHTVKALAALWDIQIPSNKTDIKKLLKATGADIFSLLLEVKKSAPEIKNLFNEIIQKNECYSLRTLAVNGSDLMAAGSISGKEIGTALDRLLDLVIEEKCENKKDALLKIFKNSYYNMP